MGIREEESLLGDPEIARLVDAAKAVRANAHAPYSRYAVGAALLAADGRIFPGVNVENSAYPTSLCAEHNALGSAVAAGARAFRAIAVCTEVKPGLRPGAPCGQCRQALSEFGLDVLVIMVGLTGELEVTPLAALLPRAFSARDL